jgi:hypothetical protein
MKQKKRSFKRNPSNRQSRKMFVISTEGSKTEPQYFSLFADVLIKIKCLKRTCKSSPLDVLKRMKKFLKEVSLKPTDEAWLVVDKDQ